MEAVFVIKLRQAWFCEIWFRSNHKTQLEATSIVWPFHCRPPTFYFSSFARVTSTMWVPLVRSMTFVMLHSPLMAILHKASSAVDLRGFPRIAHTLKSSKFSQRSSSLQRLRFTGQKWGKISSHWSAEILKDLLLTSNNITVYSIGAIIRKYETSS